LLPSGAHVSKGTWNVTLDALPFQSINPCFQALVWSAQLLRRARRFRVFLPDRELPVIDLQRHMLEANWSVWRHARTTLAVMPQSTFLPANAWARLAVELPGTAATAAAFLALNDAVDACDQAEAADHPAGPMVNAAGVQRRAAGLAVRLEVVVTESVRR
jgi:hypothetical protein